MKYRIGLDIGVASVGWSAIECDEQGEPVRIVNLGVRVFDTAEQQKTGESLAKPRRMNRSLRRRLRRRAHRLERVRFLCVRAFGDEILIKAENNTEDIFYLRYIGLSEKLQEEEIVRLAVYFAKHRGFQSNRRKELKNGETGKINSATEKNKQYMLEKGYRTIGEMIYRDFEFFDTVNGKRVYKTRNGENEYSKTFKRSDLKEEIALILQH